MKEYEYVTKKEYSPVRKEIEEEILKKVHKFLKKKYGITFQHKLIGSGRRHLITRLVGGNTGFDFDYNLILENVEEEYSPKEFKEKFIEAFNEAIKGTYYNNAENSTSAITIKVVDRINKRIVHSCDFAIIYYISDNEDDGYKYIRNNKNGKYTFEIRKVSTNLKAKIDKIESYWNNGWNIIRDEYLTVKKSNNDVDKHSFVLFLEAVNNVYNQTLQDERNSRTSYGFFN